MLEKILLFILLSPIYQYGPGWEKKKPEKKKQEKRVVTDTTLARKAREKASKYIHSKVIGKVYPVPPGDTNFVVPKIDKEALERIKHVYKGVKLPVASTHYKEDIFLPWRSDSTINAVLKDQRARNIAYRLRKVKFGFFFAYDDDERAVRRYLEFLKEKKVFLVPYVAFNHDVVVSGYQVPKYGSLWLEKTGIKPGILSPDMVRKFKIEALPAVVVIDGDTGRIYYGY